jgi:Na+/melibiose symporter-like transporter
VATVALGRDESFAAQLGVLTLLGLLASFVPAVRVVAHYGAKRVMLGSMGALALALLPMGALRPDVPGGPHDVWNLVIAAGSSLLLGPAVAGLLVVPHVVMSQLIDADELRTGANRAAMYFGVQGFLTKWVYGVSLWALTFLMSRFGNSPEEPLGVLLIGPVAGIACLLAAGVFTRYPEDQLPEEAPGAAP